MGPKFSFDTAKNSATARVALETNPEGSGERKFLAISSRAAGGQELLRVVPLMIADEQSAARTFGTETVVFGEVGLGIESGVQLLQGQLALSWASWFMHRARVGIGTWHDERDQSISGAYLRANQSLAYAASTDAKLRLYRGPLVEVSLAGRAQCAMAHPIADDLWSLSGEKQVSSAPLPTTPWEFIPMLSGGLEVTWR